jgi:hypothetical protein
MEILEKGKLRLFRHAGVDFHFRAYFTLVRHELNETQTSGSGELQDDFLWVLTKARGQTVSNLTYRWDCQPLA